MRAISWTPGAKAESIPVYSDRYVSEFDGIRAIAIGIVVSAHYRLVPIPGGFGVTLFFFLSGYLITTLFYAEYRNNSSIDIFSFYLRRWLRLTPSLIIAVLLGVIFFRITRVAVGGTNVPAGTAAAALLYYSNYYDLAWGMEPSRIIPFGIFWSLAVEEHFYLLWPIVVRNSVSNTSRFLFIIVGACVVVLVWRVVAHCVLGLSANYTYMATDSRIDSILYGALLRVLLETRWAPMVVNICKLNICRVAGVFVLLCTFTIKDQIFRDTIRYSLQGVALIPLFSIILIDRRTSFVRIILSSPIMVFIGKLSYSIYLFHLLALTPGEVAFGSPFRIQSVVAGLFLTVILAYAVFIFVELPIANIRHRLRQKKSLVHFVKTIEPQVDLDMSAPVDHRRSTRSRATQDGSISQTFSNFNFGSIINALRHGLTSVQVIERASIVTPSLADDGREALPIDVLVLCPGGLEHGGGIGRQMGYFLAALPQASETPAYRVIDTRGPWFLGSAPWRMPLSILYLLAAACQIGWAGVARRPSLLHVNLTGRGSTPRKLLLTAIARAVALPYVLHVHDYDYAADVRARSGLMQRLVRGMFASAAQIIVLGTEADKALRAALALPNAPIVVLPNAAPDPHPAPRASTTGVAREPVRLVFLGYLSARKGVPELLKALASPALAALPWRATLAGGGPVDEFRARADALGLADRVAFVGWIDQRAANALCAAADVLVLPSHAEGLAMSVLEGLAHGLAVVATPVGAHAEVIEPERSGLLTPPGDIAALSAALARVIGDPELRQRLRVGARQRFLDRYDARCYAIRLARLHVGTLGGRSLLGGIETESPLMTAATNGQCHIRAGNKGPVV
jgi:peptidoglycan/LPS O-acetylase OafA/YrhL/glycosyltransferase involved in cell wall biosynthesis